MEEKLIVDYVDETTGKFVRKSVDHMEFCVRYGIAYFESNSEPISVSIENISQIFTTR